MSPRRLVERFTRLRDHFSARDSPGKKRSPAEQSFSSDRADAPVQLQPQSQQLSSTALHSTAITTTPSNDVPAQTEANAEDTQSEGKSLRKADLWDKALASIKEPEYDRHIVAVVKTFAENPIGDDATTDVKPSNTKDLAKDISERMAEAIQDGRQGREQREWKVTIGHKEYSARGLVEKTVSILNKFVAVGDVAVSFDPVHAALPWAAVRFVLVSLTADGELRSQIMFGLAKITSLILQCDTYWRVYMTSDPTPRPLVESLEFLEASIVHTYTKSLLFLGFAYQRRQSKMGMASAPFKMNEAESYVVSLQESGDQLSQAADYCEKRCSLQNRTEVKELLNYAKESHQIMQNQSVLLMDIHQKMVFDRLKTAEGAAYNSCDNGEARCHPQTRVDILAQIYKWVGDPDSECIYWLQGMAGTGKSTISRTVAYELANQKVLGASFFFKRGEGDRGKVNRFITTIAIQLVHRLPPLAPHVQKAIEKEPDIGEMFVSKQFNSLITLPLRNMDSERQAPSIVVVVIDALDECKDKKQIREIMCQLPSVRLLTSIRLKFFVTSRPESTIFEDFAKIRYQWGPSIWKNTILHEVDNQTIEYDITAFLQHKLKSIRDDYSIYYPEEMELSEDWPAQTDFQKLVKMAVPLFIFAETACKLIENGKPGNPEKNLRRILERTTGNHTSSLDKLYLFVLKQLLHDLICPEDEFFEQFQDIVGTIVTLANPLPVAQIAKVLRIDEGTVFHMVRQLRSVLYVPSRKDAPIRPLHLSFRDFLVNRVKHETNRFWVDEKVTHKRLATRCLRLLMIGGCLKKDICDLRTPGIAWSDITKGKIDERLPSETQYACLYWVFHLKESRERVRDGDQAHGFLERHFLHWLEALSLLGRMSESIGFIDKLQSIVDTEEGT